MGMEVVVFVFMVCIAYGRHVRLRAGAAMALGQVGRGLVQRDAILDTLVDLAAEGEFRVVLGVCNALRTLGDERGAAILRGAPAP